MTLPHAPDALVIGGGVIGCAVARELAGSRTVVLVDRGPLGGEASGAAAGVLAAASGDDQGERLALRRASLDAFPGLAAALLEETGIDVGFERRGVLTLVCGDADLEAARAHVTARRTQGFRVELAGADAVRALEPSIGDGVRGGILHPDDAVVVGERLVAALAASARCRGATLVPGLPALAVGTAGDRVTRVRIGADWIAPGLVIVATGAWGASAIAGLDVGVTIAPVRGQMMALRPREPPRRVLTSGTAFLVPRPHGEVWVGATFEDAGFVKAVTADGLRVLASHVERLAPALMDAPMVRAWAGLRPHCPDGPVLGRPRDLANLLVALGHHRNGILLAPLTASAIRACADGVAVPPEARPFVVAS